MKNSQKGSANMTLIIMVIVLAGVIGYLALSKQSNVLEVVSEQSQDVALVSINEIKNWSTYKNTQLGFEFKYPQDVFSPPQLTTSKGRVIVDMNDINDMPNNRELLSGLRLCDLAADNNCLKKEGDIISYGLTLHFINENDAYQTYEGSVPFFSQDKNYSKVIIGGASGYKINNGPRNEVALIKLKQPYFIRTLQMSAYKDTCTTSSTECGPIEVEDNKTKITYEQILTTFKFTSN
jgi:hypothetical protein